METTATANIRSLQHIYFFVDRAQEKPEQTSMTTESAAQQQPAIAIDTAMSAASSSSAAEHEGASTTSVASTATSRSPSPSTQSGASVVDSTPLTPSAPSFEPRKASPICSFNPAAQIFVPAPEQRPHPVGPPFEVRELANKGFGLVATRFIPSGTRLIFEIPLLKIPENQLHLVCVAYDKLSAEQKAVYDQLHGHQPSNLDLDHAARSFLIYCGQWRTEARAPSSDENFEKEVARYSRVMAIFATNNFILASGKSHGVFPTVSRLNHSCVPNVHHTNVGKAERQRVHAIRGIMAGEELVANYLGAKAAYQPSHARQKQLQDAFGFVCQCVACDDRTGESDRRRMILNNIFWGLNEYCDGTQRQSEEDVFIPADDSWALNQAEDGIRLLQAEGLCTTELCKAFRKASTFAMSIRDYGRALGCALEEEAVEYNIHGEEVHDLEKAGKASRQWIHRIQDQMASEGVHLPHNFWDMFSQRTRRKFGPKSHQKGKAHPKKKQMFHRKNRSQAESNAEGA